MKKILFHLCILVLAVTVGHNTSGEVLGQNDNLINKVLPGVLEPKIASVKENVRLKRQDTATTLKPKKNRPSNIFSLISELVSETRDDANRAFNEIGTLFNSQFSNASAQVTSTTTTTTPDTDTPTSSETTDDAEEITTTTEPYSITREEFLGILRSNVRGLARLFGKEFRVALQDSNKNVREFGRDLGNALRPYFT